MTNTITLGSPPAPKQPRSFIEMAPGQIVVPIQGAFLAAVKTKGGRLITLRDGTEWTSPEAAFNDGAGHVLLPGESLTITVGE